jgi:hypothetical protein
MPGSGSLSRNLTKNLNVNITVMKQFLFLTSMVLFSMVQAQEAGTGPLWKRKFQAGLNINGASFSDNWKAGGVNSTSWNALLNFRTDKNRSTYEWTNDLQTQYGSVKLKEEKARKSSDRLFFESKASHKFTETWRGFASTNLISQFAAGYDYNKSVDGNDSFTRISNFLSPGYLTEALGVEYKPVTWFSAEAGIIGVRQTFVLDQGLYDQAGKEVLYGVNRGQRHREQVVFQLIGNFDKEILKNTNLKARYMMVGDWRRLVESEFLVHRLDVNLVAKVNRYINVSLGGVLLYDIDMDRSVQNSQQLSIGILYTLQNFKEEK